MRLYRWLPGAAAVLFLLHALFYFYALGGDAVDDAYISFRYARNAILGLGLVFNPGERVEGFTNFLWTALLMPVAGAGADVGRVSILLGVLFGLGGLWLAARLAHALGLPPAAGWLAACLLAVDGSFAIWSVSGLETALFGFLLTAGALFYLKEQVESISAVNGRGAQGRRLPASGVLFALAAMTRPEAAAVFGLTVGHQLLWRVLAERRLLTRTDLARGLVFAGLFVPYWLFRWRYYHSFFPNSFYAKVAPGGPAAQIERGWHYVSQFMQVHLWWLILLPALLALTFAAAAWLRADSRGALASSVRPPSSVLRPRASRLSFMGLSYLALVLVAYCVYIVYVGGDWSVGRFFAPLLPMLYVLVAAGLVQMGRFVSFPGSDPARAVAVAALLLALAWTSSWNGEYGIFVRGFDAARATQAREAMGKWLKANVAAGTWIAVDAAGQVPYFSGLPAIDMFGINDLHIGRLSVPTLGEGTPGHEKFDLGYIIERRPRYVIIYGNLFDSVTEYRRADAPWTNDPALTQFLTLYERR